MIQQWCCDNCGVSGSVAHLKHADVYTVFNALKDDHNEKSPACGRDTKLRVRNRELCTREEWQEIKRKAKGGSQ